MYVLNHDRISELIQHQSPLSISLFMPTHRAGREQQQDLIRLKNLVKEAMEQARERSDSASQVDQLLKPFDDLRVDDSFWRYRSDGLACFCRPQFFRAYRVPIKLKERLFVNDRFHIRPLLPLLRSDARVYILSLTQETARLFEATRYSIREIELPELAPLELSDDEQPHQYHSHQAPSQGKGATAEAVYHGQGGPADRSKKDTLKFFQRVDQAVSRTLRGQRAPLVLACVGYLSSLYESANSYKHLSKGKVPGSPDRWSEDELREHAWKLVEPYLKQTQQQAWEQFQDATGNGRGSDELRSVVLAAEEGRIDTLFLARDEERWGHVDPDLQAVQTTDDKHDGEELLDFAAMKTLSNGGEVFLFDSLPNTDAPAAATYRY